MRIDAPSMAKTAGLRAEIRAEVAAIAPMDHQESQDITACLDWIDSGANFTCQHY